MTKETSKIREMVSSLKDFFIFLREAAIISIFLLILFFPVSFNTVLSRAGFVEGNIAGFTWRNQLNKTDKTLQKANETIQQLESELAESNKIIQELTAEVDAQKAEKLKTQTIKNTRVLKDVKSRDEAIQKTLQMNKSMLERQQFQIQPISEWGVISGPHMDLQHARVQQEQALERGFGQSRIYQKHQEYWNVLLFQSEEKAHDMLMKLERSGLHADMVNLNEFCPHAGLSQQRDIWICEE
ncbi:hypothetical protein JW835_02495 [bacterium]|nr:hypothetical protein [bacterium]